MQFAHYIAQTLLSAYAFWLLFVMCMGFYAVWPRMPIIAKLLALPAIIFALIFDITWNYTLGTLMFLEPPHHGAYTFTERISQYLLEKGWRNTVAKFICGHFLDVFQSGGHCR